MECQLCNKTFKDQRDLYIGRESKNINIFSPYELNYNQHSPQSNNDFLVLNFTSYAL